MGVIDMLEDILVSFIAALVTAALTYLVYWRKVEADLRKEYKARFNEQKWKAYLDFIVMQSRLESQMSHQSTEIRAALVLVASDEVIKAYNDYVSVPLRERSGETFHKRVGVMIGEMRRDLGYDSKVSPEDLWTMYGSIHET